MPAVSSEMYIPAADYKATTKFNRVPIHVLNVKTNSPDQEIFQINASKSYDTSPVEFDGSLRNSVIKFLNNDHFKQPPESIQEVAQFETTSKNNNDAYPIKENKYWNFGNGNIKDESVTLGEKRIGLTDGHPVCIECKKDIKR